MSDSRARAISRASVRSMEFAAIIPPVEIDFGGGTGVHEGKSISTGGGAGAGGSDPLGRRSKVGYAIFLMTVPCLPS